MANLAVIIIAWTAGVSMLLAVVGNAFQHKRTRELRAEAEMGAIVQNAQEQVLREMREQLSKCNYPSPDERWRCPQDAGHVGVHENYHAAWWGRVWFPVLRESDWAALFDVTPGALWELPPEVSV